MPRGIFAQEQQLIEFKGRGNEKIQIDDNKKKTYFLIGPKKDETPPEGGWKLVLLMPGGDGSAEFNMFCRRIQMNGLPDGYAAVQLVAPAWSDDDKRVVWPTEQLNPQKAKFTTEQFIEEAIVDVSKRIEVNSQFVFALGWSSSGPPIYSASMNKESSLTGSFVAMSVFGNLKLPNIKNAKGKNYYLLHSPDDWIKIDEHARVAETKLKEAGANVKLQTYSGGHGWREDPYGHINRGIKWLEKHSESKQASPKKDMP